eukprot:TRINITY_DN9675_c0_g1_i1.p1 TRINITY_DN9675_c0_g1~~TRINITY_DN9675_c0_g1_i1.p1  ORF type:complete len:984 (-),score=199.71 TRINITY_DN9675_c0_g1_i1:27-2978(-)
MDIASEGYGRVLTKMDSSMEIPINMSIPDDSVNGSITMVDPSISLVDTVVSAPIHTPPDTVGMGVIHPSMNNSTIDTVNDVIVIEDNDEMVIEDENTVVEVKTKKRKRSNSKKIVKKRRSSVNHSETLSIDDFYEHIRCKYTPENAYQPYKKPRKLLTDLYPYQIRALKWMIDRENQVDIRGGLLADEMGLGKTIETLALVCNNQRYSENNRLTFGDDNHFDTKATLIIVPSILIKQWTDEIKKHTTLKYMIYQGISFLSRKQAKVPNFRQYDIVLTSYDILRKEIHFVEPHKMRLRRSSQKPKSPLIEMRWWRMCLDEAQEVRTKTAQSAKMAKNINAINLWAISGTPIKKTVEDLLGIIIFLGCEEYWKMPTDELLEKFSEISWRNTKLLIENEIDIPPKEDEENIIELSNLETLLKNMLASILLKKGSHENKYQLDKFNSVPYLVMFQELGKENIKVHASNRNEFLNFAIKRQSFDLYETLVEYCIAINEMGAYYYMNGNLKKSSEYFERSLKIAVEQKDENGNYTNIGFYRVIYQSIVNLLDINPDRAELIELMRDTKYKLFIREDTKLKRIEARYKEELNIINTLVDNRKLSPHGEWWNRALNYLKKYDKGQFIQNLREGVTQIIQTRQVVGIKIKLEMPELTDYDELRGIIKNTVNLIDESREETNYLLNLPLPEHKYQISEEERNIERINECLNRYESSLAVFEKVIRKSSISQTERILLEMERYLIEIYNSINPGNPRISKTIRLYNALSLILYECEAHFRELELLKSNIIFCQDLLTERTKHLITLTDFEQQASIKLDDNIQLEKLQSTLTKWEEKVNKKKELIKYLNSEKEANTPENYKYGSLIGSVLDKILYLLGEDENCKILVFSAYTESLNKVGDLLKHRRIPHSGGKGTGITSKRLADRIREFQTKEQYKVLLLNSLRQSTGLTLIEANHVILMEPVDEASEEQAIGRAYRLGQNQQTLVHRFVFGGHS